MLPPAYMVPKYPSLNRVYLLKNFKLRNFKEEIDFFFNFRDISLSFVLLLSWVNWIGKMWISMVTRGEKGKLSLSEDAFNR